MSDESQRSGGPMETDAQRAAFEAAYRVAPDAGWFHDTPHALVRYLRDRRLKRALDALRELGGPELQSLSVLVVCGGAGGEASFLRRAGCAAVTNSDLSQSALAHCRRRDPLLTTLQLDGQALALPDDSFDLVLVQDGLH